MMEVDWISLAAIAGAFVVVASSPGPANLAAATVAMSEGRRTGLIFALGLATGLWIWGLLAAAGLGAVLQASSSALVVFKVVGGLYLLWLAWQSFRSAARAAAAKTPKIKATKRRWFLRGLLLNLTNPKAVFAWMAALSVGLDQQQDNLVMVAVATILCGLIALLNATGHVWLFSRPAVMDTYMRLRRWIDGVVAAVFATAGFGLLRSAFVR